MALRQTLTIDKDAIKIDKERIEELMGFKNILNNQLTQFDATFKAWIISIIDQIIEVENKNPDAINNTMYFLVESKKISAEAVSISTEIVLKFTEFMKFFNENKANLLKQNIFIEYTKRISELEAKMTILESLMIKEEKAYEEMLPFVNQVISLGKKVHEIESSLTNKKHKDNIKFTDQLKSFQTFHNNVMDIPVYVVLVKYNNSNTFLLEEMKGALLKEGKVESYEAATKEMKRLQPTYKENIQFVKDASKKYKELKALRDAKLNEVKAKQQHGQFKSAPPIVTPSSTPPSVGLKA